MTRCGAARPVGASARTARRWTPIVSAAVVARVRAAECTIAALHPIWDGPNLDLDPGGPPTRTRPALAHLTAAGSLRCRGSLRRRRPLLSGAAAEHRAPADACSVVAPRAPGEARQARRGNRHDEIGPTARCCAQSRYETCSACCPSPLRHHRRIAGDHPRPGRRLGRSIPARLVLVVPRRPGRAPRPDPRTVPRRTAPLHRRPVRAGRQDRRARRLAVDPHPRPLLARQPRADDRRPSGSGRTRPAWPVMRRRCGRLRRHPAQLRR